jgi:ArsR family transcriptional regulator, arsenate/arsenite/antimonite-responsive transcriptional repressor
MLTDQSMDVNMFVMKLIQQFEACCASLVASPLDRDGADTLAGALRALADPARLRLVSLLAGQPDAEACVCNLTEPLGLSQPTVSHHLRVLTEAGILEREQRGRWAFYRLRTEPLRALSTALNLAEAPTPA